MTNITFSNSKFDLKYAPRLAFNEGGGGNTAIKTTFSPRKLVEFFDLYERERKESFRIYRIIENFLSTTLLNFRLRVIENPKKEVIAGYTCKLRENKLEEKSLFVECIARKRNTDDNTKKQMTNLYEDIKKTAIKKKAKEITLFVHADEPNLRHNYENLGFKIDNKCKVEKMYLMRVRVSDFLNTLSFKTRKYKEALGIKSILNVVK